MHSQEDLNRVRQIILEHLRGYAARVYIFGSRARNNARRGSDIDVAILPLAPIPRWVFSDIRQALEDSTILYPVDVVDLSESDENFRARVLAEGVLWSE